MEFESNQIKVPLDHEHSDTIPLVTTDEEKFIKRIVNPQLAVNSGVYAAVDPSLTMRLNERGEYEYLGIEKSLPRFAGQFLRVSAFGQESPDESVVARDLYAREEGVQYHNVAGYYTGIFAGWACDDDIRLNASSGGITTWLLCDLLSQGEIDGVIHMKPGTGGGALFEYQISRTHEEILNGAKTRYYPGELSSVLKDIQHLEGKYALVAIPSIVYEVRLLQRLDPAYRKKIALIVGLICGHQKTANYAEYLGWRMGVAPGALQSIDFRKKISGLPTNSYSTEVTGIIEGLPQKKIASQDHLPGTDWGLGFFKSHFSDLTEDALNECADLVVGDAWLPQYTSDSRGTNVILTRNNLVLQALKEGCQRGEIHLENLSVSELLHSQASLIKQNVGEIEYRVSYLKKLGCKVPASLRRPSPKGISFVRKAIQRTRVRTSHFSHEAYQEAREQVDLHIFDKKMKPLVRNYRNAQRLNRAVLILIKFLPMRQ